jgi:hypothetical protein
MSLKDVKEEAEVLVTYLVTNKKSKDFKNLYILWVGRFLKTVSFVEGGTATEDELWQMLRDSPVPVGLLCSRGPAMKAFLRKESS